MTLVTLKRILLVAGAWLLLGGCADPGLVADSVRSRLAACARRELVEAVQQDPRIMGDIARRLCGEQPWSREPRAPLPKEGG